MTRHHEPIYACLVCGMTRYQIGPCYCCRVFDDKRENKNDRRY